MDKKIITYFNYCQSLIYKDIRGYIFTSISTSKFKVKKMGIFFNNLTSGIYLGRDGSHFRFSTDSAITSIRPLSVLHTSALRESLKSTLY